MRIRGGLPGGMVGADPSGRVRDHTVHETSMET